MIRLLARILHRPIHDLDDSPAIARAQEAGKQADAAELRINQTIAALKRRDLSGNPLENDLFPPHHRPQEQGR